MKKYSLVALLVFAALCGCRKRVSAPIQFPLWEETAVWQDSMKIDSITNMNGTFYQVAKGGDMNVFMYHNNRGMSDYVYDNDYWAALYFAVASDQMSFSYTDVELAEHYCYYTGAGGGNGYGYEVLDKGSISGTKQPGGSWNVSIDVTLKKMEPALNTSHIQLNKTFHEGNYY
ncbi:MAG TPA: hypothetical protein VEB40_15590 [Flavipsychrobacter sp.]|nr:hypothetical protein [Flavipsychrobacter sp.]